jgi:hypothetical protein
VAVALGAGSVVVPVVLGAGSVVEVGAGSAVAIGAGSVAIGAGSVAVATGAGSVAVGLGVGTTEVVEVGAGAAVAVAIGLGCGGTGAFVAAWSAAFASRADLPSLGPSAQATSASAPKAEKTIAEAEPLKERMSHSPVRFRSMHGSLATRPARGIRLRREPTGQPLRCQRAMLAFLRVVR